MIKFKKVICLVLIAAISLTLSACDPVKTVINLINHDEEDVREVVTAYMDNICRLDLKNASEYADGDVRLPFANIGSLISKTLDAVFGDDEEFASVEKDLEPVITKLVNAIKDSMTYEIEGIGVEGKNATVKVSMTILNTDNISLENFDLENIDFDFESFFGELLESGKISFNSSEEDIFSYFVPKIVEVMTSELQKQIDNAGTKTVEKEITLSKKDNKWLVTNAEEFFNELDEISK